MNARRPHIVHIYKDVYPPIEGGIERILALMARLTAASGEFEVSILTASRDRRGRERELAPGVRVVEIPSLGRALSSPLAPGFISAIKRSRADLLHFHIPHPTGEVAWLLSGLRVPAVATYHSDVVRQAWAMSVYGVFFKRFLKRLDLIMPTTARYVETSPWLGPHRGKCRPVALGYPLEEYALTPGREVRLKGFRKRFGDYFLFLGCLRAYKGLPYLVEAMERTPEAKLVIAGDGRVRGEIEALISEKTLGDRVTMLGRIDEDDAVALLHGATALMLPSHQRSEAFGLCQIEAMACATPVISTNLPTGVPEVNAHNESGLIVEPADPAALAGAMELLMKNPDGRRRLGEGAKARATARFRAETMTDNVMGIYREALSLK